MGSGLSSVRTLARLIAALTACAGPLLWADPIFSPLEPTSESLSLAATGSRGSFRSVLRPSVDVSLSARAAGIVEVIHVPEGGTVRKGQPIISLDSTEERAEVAQAEASLRGTKAEAERSAAELERIQQLRQENIYSDKQFLDAKAQAELAASRHEQAMAAVALARARLANRDVLSPIDGIFLKTTKQVGEAVERYETIARVVDVTSLEVVVFCDARFFSIFANGQQVDLKVLKTAEDQPIISGTVFHVDPIVDPTSGTFRVKVKIERSAQAIPGYAAILIAPPA